MEHPVVAGQIERGDDHQRHVPQLLRRNALPPGERIRRQHAGQLPAGADLPHRAAGPVAEFRLVAHREGHVQLVLQQLLFQHVRGQALDLHVAVRIQRLELVYIIQKVGLGAVGVQRADAQALPVAAGIFLRLQQTALQLGEQGLPLGIEVLPGLREGEGLALPVEEPDADGLFQTEHALAQGGLGDVQIAGGAGVAAGLGGVDEIPQLHDAEVEVFQLHGLTSGEWL